MRTLVKNTVNVYEIRNEHRKEICVGISALSANEYIAGFGKNRFLEVAHWDLANERILLSYIELDLSSSMADAFVAEYLKNSVLTPAHGCGNSMDSKANLIREAIRLQYIETRKIPNPRNPHYDTTACQLNRNHPEVRRILGPSN